MEDYLHALNDDEILTTVERLMNVSISHFFRDTYLWRTLDEDILPDIIRRCKERVDVWSAGCAMGQEVYSFAILWDMMKGRFNQPPLLHLRATDSNPDYLEKARAGIYRRSSLKGLPGEIRAQYFRILEDELNYLVDDYLKKDITWEVHDLIRQPPPAEKFHITFLRNNLLTYYREENRESAFLNIVESIDEEGFLIIGSHERVPSQSHALLQLKGCPYILQKT
jgi:chemotaxis protein methyltransferase CheR